MGQYGATIKQSQTRMTAGEHDGSGGAIIVFYRSKKTGKKVTKKACALNHHGLPYWNYGRKN
jgi:hypothetical protein